MDSNVLKQQLIGTVRLTTPVVIAYYLIGPCVCTYVSLRCLIATLLGCCVGYKQYVAMKALANSLLYKPTMPHKQALDSVLQHCNLDPSRVAIRYAFTNGQVAMCILNTVVIDPSILPALPTDEAAVKVCNIIEETMLPSLTEKQRDFLQQQKATITPESHAFMVRHELGHVAHKYSHKRIVATGAVCFIASFAAMTAFVVLAPLVGTLTACLLCCCLGSCLDIVMSYIVQGTFKYNAEKKADFFAAHRSTVQELHAAAAFFEHHEVHLGQVRSGIAQYLPARYLSGHPSGQERSCYLRTFARAMSVHDQDQA